jgi:hypothetical protein
MANLEGNGPLLVKSQSRCEKEIQIGRCCMVYMIRQLAKTRPQDRDNVYIRSIVGLDEMVW